MDKLLILTHSKKQPAGNPAACEAHTKGGTDARLTVTIATADACGRWKAGANEKQRSSERQVDDVMWCQCLGTSSGTGREGWALSEALRRCDEL